MKKIIAIPGDKDHESLIFDTITQCEDFFQLGNYELEKYLNNGDKPFHCTYRNCAKVYFFDYFLE